MERRRESIGGRKGRRCVVEGGGGGRGREDGEKRMGRGRAGGEGGRGRRLERERERRGIKRGQRGKGGVRQTVGRSVMDEEGPAARDREDDGEHEKTDRARRGQQRVWGAASGENERKTIPAGGGSSLQKSESETANRSSQKRKGSESALLPDGRGGQLERLGERVRYSPALCRCRRSFLDCTRAHLKCSSLRAVSSLPWHLPYINVSLPSHISIP